MFANQTTLSFFQTLVWVHDLKPDDWAGINAGAAKRIDKLLTPRPDVPVGHSWQTETDLHTRKELHDLNRFVMAAAEGVLDFLHIDYKSVTITGCWANISVPGAYHHEHSHPNNFLSAVYYIKAPEGGDAITFEDPRPQAHVIAPPVKKKSALTASTVTLDVKPGRLVLFPSWLKHAVAPNKSDEERWSVSFNIMFDGYVERMSKPRFQGRLTGAGKKDR